MAPRFKKVFQSPNLLRLLKYHAVRQQEREEGDLVYDVQDTQFWRRMYSENGPLDGDPFNLLLAFSADPVHPFKITNSQYSMCPLSLQILNFPSADERILLWSVLPGPKKPKSLSTYLGPLVDQLLQLEEGVECYHSDTRERFKLKARCMCDILDYKGQQMFLNTLGQNAFQGCKKCQQSGTYLPILIKVVYTDSKTFLLINHPLCSESGPIFPHGGEEIRPPPKTVVPATPAWCCLWKGKGEWRQQHCVTRQGEINWFEKFAGLWQAPILWRNLRCSDRGDAHDSTNRAPFGAAVDGCRPHG